MKKWTLDKELEGKQSKDARFTNMLHHSKTGMISTIDSIGKLKIEWLWEISQGRLYKKKKNW